jgi:PAS domain S-box-containing protein
MGHEPTDHPGSEVKRLQRCMSDLVSVLALPAVWSSSEPNRILDTFLDALLDILDLDFLYARVRLDPHEAPIDALRTAPLHGTNRSREEIRRALNQWSGEAPQQWPEQAFKPQGMQEVSVFPIRMGIEGDLGLIVAGSQRLGFPEQTERLVLSVAANQAAIGLQQAKRLAEQKRVAGELDRRVAKRTRELAEANKELQLQVGLLQHLPVSTWTLKPDGTPDFVNQVWLEFSGQTLDFVRSHPEAWMTAVHPEDRESASKAFWEGVGSGKDFAFETRSLRARDGTYRWHLQQAVVLRDAEGNVLKFIGTTTDIDDQKRAEEELRASEGKLRRVIDTIPSLSWCNLPDGPNEFLSKGWHDYTGLSPEEAHGWGWSGAFHPDDLPPLMKRWQELLISGEEGEIEARIRRHDGVYRWFLIRVAPFRDETGEIIRWYGTSTDIEGRKRAEDALRASELSLRQIIDNIPGLVSTLGPNGETVLINGQILEYFGKTLDELKSWRLSDAIHPDDLPRIVALHAQSIQPGVPFGSEYRLRRADGVYRWFQFRAEPVRDSAGGVVGWYVLATDIHDRKQAEEALQASERTFASIINTIPTLAWSARPDGCCDFLSRGWLGFTGLSSEQAQGWGWSDAIHPEDRDKLVRNWQSSIASGMPVDTEARLRRFDGVYRWTLIRANPWHDETGSIVKWYGTNTDIDDRKLAEEQVLRSEAFLAEAQRLTRVGSFSWRVPTGEIKWSEQLYRIFEFEQGTTITFDLIRSRFHSEDLPLLNEMTEQTRRGVTDLEYEHRIQMPNGSIKYLRLVAHASRDHGGKLEYIGAIQDVTQRQLAEAALTKAREELAKVTRITSFGALSASIAHEVNQPLSGIITNAGTCLRMLNSDPPNVDGAKETMHRAIRDGNRASDVIDRLRALFSKKDVAAEPVDLNDATREVITLSLSDLQRQRVVLQLELADSLPTLIGDRIQLQQVVLNLLRNASEAMSSIEDRTRSLIIRTEHAGGDIRLTVQDSGIGLANGEAERVFESFFTTKEDGMGIGLSVSRSIIEAHNGRLWATPNEGHGATFAFTIPCEQAS